MQQEEHLAVTVVRYYYRLEIPSAGDHELDYVPTLVDILSWTYLKEFSISISLHIGRN